MTVGRRDSGQATVEFALILPFMVVLLMAIAQVAAIAYLQVAVTHLSREIARELAVDPTADVGRLANEHSIAGHDGLQIETQMIPAGPDGQPAIVVRVTHNDVAISGIFQRFLADVSVSAETRMMAEP